MENEVPKTPTPETQITPQEATQPPATVAPKPKPWLILGLVTLVLLFLGTTGFLAYQNFQLKQQVMQKGPAPQPELTKQPDSSSPPPLPESTRPPETFSPTPTKDATASWETYTNTQEEFSIKYPTGWRKVETENWVGFGPQEIGEDVVWGISFYDKSEKTISEIKSEVGKQFSDRKQTEETVTFDELTATKVVTTTNEFEGWYSVTIIIESENKLYAIGNGAQTDTTLNETLLKRTGKEYNLSFEDFYSSFGLSK